MKPEEALVILLSRLTFDKLTKVRIFHLIKNGIDWYLFLNVCVRRKLICLVYKNLRDLGLIQLLPMIIINNMQYHYQCNEEENKNFILIAETIVSYFEANDILVVPIKGIRFLETIYNKEPGVRILSDIDFIASAKNQVQIHDYMQKSGYNTYLINDRDVLFSTNSNIKSYFYIKFEGENFYGKLRIDIDFGYPDSWLQLIKTSAQPIYEFLYLCTSYYNESYNEIASHSVTSYNYAKLVDIYEYCRKHLTSYSIDQIYIHATDLNVHNEVLFTIKCLETIYADFFDR